MIRSHRYLLLIACLGSFMACLQKKIPTNSISVSETGARGVPIYLALGEPKQDTYQLHLSSAETVKGLVFCVTSTATTIQDCATGKGEFMTTEPLQLKNGQRFFKANLPFLPLPNLQLTVVAIDALGANLGQQTLTFHKK